MDEEISKVLSTHGRLAVDLATLSDDDDLFQAGMTSHANVNVMLALEDAFDIEFPEAMLLRSTFSSIASIRDAVGNLMAMQAAS